MTGRVEEALARERLGREDLAREGHQLPAQPGGDRDREALLPAADDLLGEQRRDRAAQQPLLREAAHLAAASAAPSANSATRWSRNGTRSLERVRHARPVGLDQQVVDQVDAEVDVLQARERLGARGLGVARAVEVERVPARVAPRRAARPARRGEKISFQAWWRSSGGRCAPRTKRLAL